MISAKRKIILAVAIVVGAAIVVGSAFGINYLVEQKQISKQNDIYYDEISSSLSSAENSDNFMVNMDVYACSGTTDDAPQYGEPATISPQANIFFGFENYGEPALNLSLSEGDVSTDIYLRNGRFYMCSDYGSSMNDYIKEVVPAEQILGENWKNDLNFGLSGAGNIDWDELTGGEDLSELMGGLGIDFVDLQSVKSLVKEVEKEQGDGYLEYKFTFNMRYFNKQLFDPMEKEAGYKLSDKNVVAYLKLEEGSADIWFEVGFTFNVGVYRFVFSKIILDMAIDYGVNAPELPCASDVEIMDKMNTFNPVDGKEEVFGESAVLNQSYWPSLDGAIKFYKFSVRDDMWGITNERFAWMPECDMVAVYNGYNVDLFRLSSFEKIYSMSFYSKIYDVEYTEGQMIVMLESQSIPDVYYMSESYDNLNFVCVDLETFNHHTVTVGGTGILSPKMSAVCGNKVAFSDGKGYYLVNLADGSYTYNCKLDGIKEKAYYDENSGLLHLSDYYAGDIAVDPATGEWKQVTFPQKPAYDYLGHPDGYDRVECFAKWKEYDVAHIYTEWGYLYIGLYDRARNIVVSKSIAENITAVNDFTITSDGRLINFDSMYPNTVEVIDLNILYENAVIA